MPRYGSVFLFSYDTPPFIDFSSFREMIWEEGGAAQAKVRASGLAARAEIGSAVAEQRRLMGECFKLRLQLALGEIRLSENAV